MSQFKTLFKTLLKIQLSANQVNTKRGKKSVSMLLAFILTGVLFAAMSVIYSITLAPLYNEAGLLYQFVVTLCFIVIIFTLIFGLLFLMNLLYFSKDNSFLMTLPISDNKLYFCKLLISYLFSLYYSVIIMVPAVIAIGVTCSLYAQFYVFGILAALFMPFISMLFASIISVPVMFLITFLKRFPTVSKVLRIILIALVFVVYIAFVFIVSMNENNPGSTALEPAPWIETAALVIYPVSAIARAMLRRPVFGFTAATGTAVNMLLFFGIVIVATLICMLITHKSYSYLIAKQSESGSVSAPRLKKVKVKSDAKEGKPTSLLNILIKREFLNFGSNMNLTFLTIMDVLFIPAMTLIMTLSIGVSAQGDATQAEVAAILTPIIYITISYMAQFMPSYSETGAFSRDAHILQYYFQLPIDMKVYIKSKIIVAVIVSSIGATLSVIMLAALSFDIMLFWPMIIFLFLNGIASALFGMWMDLRKPSTNWTSVEQLYRNNKMALIPMLFQFLYLVATLAVSVPILVFVELRLATLIVLCIFCVLYAVPICLLYYSLMKNGIAKIDRGFKK